MDRDYDDWFPSISLTMPVGKVRIAIFAKQRHTIMLLCHCEARPYATYGYRNHRRHIQGLSSYSGLVCAPPYSQNVGVVSTYVTVW